MSFLFGDWARFIRTNGQVINAARKFSPKHETFRRAFFAAACYYGRRGETTLCLDNLRRAFRHGFGLYQYGRINSKRPNFPKTLLEERAMLRNAMNEMLTDKTVKRYVNVYWKLNQYP